MPFRGPEPPRSPLPTPPPGAAQNPPKDRGQVIPGHPGWNPPQGVDPDLWAFDNQGRIDQMGENNAELLHNNVINPNLPRGPMGPVRNTGMPVGMELPIIGPIDYPNNAPPVLPPYYGTPTTLPAPLPRELTGYEKYLDDLEKNPPPQEPPRFPFHHDDPVK